jgi:hypothetical protein
LAAMFVGRMEPNDDTGSVGWASSFFFI